jgi:IS605 OrfB family transposase
MIKETRHILKFNNAQKSEWLNRLFEDFKNDLHIYINSIVSGELPFGKYLSIIPKLPNTKIKHSQWKQVLYKEAIAKIQSVMDNVRHQTFVKYKKLYVKCLEKDNHKKFTSKRFSELNINYLKRVKIDIKKVSIPIDQRMLSVIREKQTELFDEFVGVRLPYFKENIKRAIQINLPIKYHKLYNQYILDGWDRKNTIKLTKSNNCFYLCFALEKDNSEKKTSGKTLGIDIGYKKLIVDSNGNQYGKELKQIYERLSKKVRGSKNYKQLVSFKKNKINEVVNKFYQENCDVHTLYAENLKSVKTNSKLGKHFNNKLQYWSYAQVLNKLETLSEREGFYFFKVNPAYTSQTCSFCGEVDKSARNGEVYQCKNCKTTIDADYNAAINVLHRGIYSSSTTKDKS